MKFLISFANICCIVILYFLFKISNYNDFIIRTTNKQYNGTGAEIEIDQLQNNTITYIIIILIFTIYGCTIGSFSNYFILRYMRLIEDEQNSYTPHCRNLVDWYKDMAFVTRNLIVFLSIVVIVFAIIFKYDLFLIYAIFVAVTGAFGLSTWLVNVGESFCTLLSKVLCCRCCIKKTRL